MRRISPMFLVVLGLAATACAARTSSSSVPRSSDREFTTTENREWTSSDGSSRDVNVTIEDGRRLEGPSDQPNYQPAPTTTYYESTTTTTYRPPAYTGPYETQPAPAGQSVQDIIRGYDRAR